MKRINIDTHSINNTIKKVNDFYLAKSQELVEGEDISEYLKEIKKANDYIENILSTSDEELISITTLNAMDTQLSTLFNHISNYLVNQNSVQTSTINSNFHSLYNLITILEISVPLSGQDIFDRISSMRRNLTLIENDAKQKEEEIKINLNNIENDFKENFEKQKTLIDSLNKKIEESNKTIVQQSNEIEKYKTIIKTYFDQKDVSFSKLLDQFKLEKEKELKELTTKFEKQYSENYSKYDTIHKNYVENAEKYSNQLAKLVNIAGKNGAKAPYVEAANNERKASILWRTIAMISMSIFVFFSIIIATNYNGYFTADSEWYAYLGRFFILTGMATIVAYSSKIASKHKENHRYYRQLALEFDSIFLFLSSLEDQDVNDIKKGLVEKYYANIENPNNRRDDEGININIKNLEKLLDLVSKLKK